MSPDWKRRGLFVTGTDTGVGKTIVTAGLVSLARKRGLRARAVKPIETGCPVKSGMLSPEDGIVLQRASEEDLTLDESVPFRFSLPASPYRAAAMEGRQLKLFDVVEHVLALAEDADLTIVEGAGGLMVPIEEKLLMIDLIERLGFPVLLVARTTLGTINHTLLSLEALRRRGVRAAGIVLSGGSSASGPEEEYTPRDLARLVGDVPVEVLPRLSPEVVRDPGRIAAALSSLWSEELLASWLGT
jgi:dethiobiotin synthetase